MEKALVSYTIKLKKTLVSTLPKALVADEEAIHDFRVTLKKTRTVLNFVEFWSYGQCSKTEILRKFRPIFKRTGRIRELHIHQNLLPELAEKTGLDLTYLNKKVHYQIDRNLKPLNQELKAFKKATPGLFKEITQLIKTAEKGKQRMDAAPDFQVRLEKRIQKILALEDPDLHKIRTFLKQKVYVFDSFQESELLAFYKEFRAEWKILESSIGKWHDELMFHDWLLKGLQWKRLTDEQYKIQMKLIGYLRSSTDRMEIELLNSIPRLSIK